MTAKNLQKIEPNLEVSGFEETGENTFAWKGSEIHLTRREPLPWILSQWEVEEVEGTHYRQRHFVTRLSRDDVLANIEAAMSQDFPAFRAVASLDDRQQGFWLLFEFCDRDLEADQSRIIEEDQLHTQLPHGLAGLHIEVVQSQGQISLFMTKHFFLGNIPGNIFLELPRVISTATFGQSLIGNVQYNLYAAVLKCGLLRRALIEACDLPETLAHKLLLETLDDNQIRLEEQGSSWMLSWEEGHELPPLVIPPIEVLELKEVARRFQRLDDFIVQSDYEQALKQCYEYLAKSPQSLYLIRRLAFLTLWAQRPLERHYLDLMAKLDAQNLMSISMGIRNCFGDQSRNQALEFLSKLGNSLGQTIIDFEIADITSLTLPEMLGDAWNVKDDKRAVACYERVLQARGEVPRILVKLIRLMRDLNDPRAEEAYIDRLLACEVPVRTRAAIYFRLAEIKESLNQKEAVQWALKSWQTNRSHVRYALLAARLLLVLNRPQDAIHVLVETSDQLSESESIATRLDLELQIATIWLDHLNRQDLAAERLSRARELAGDDPLAFGRMAHIAEHLGDQSQHVDLLLMAFDTAIKAADQTRADFAASSLIDLAEAIQDPAKQKHIYTVILSQHLLDAERLSPIFARSDLQLPFDQILPAMQAMLASKAESEQGPYFDMLGKLCAQRLNRKLEARQFFEAGARVQYVSQAAFDFLDNIYASEGKIEGALERHRLMKLRYSLAPQAERGSILRDLFYCDEGVEDAERDSYAVQIFALDPDDRGPLEERIAVYQQQGQAMALTELLEAVVSAVPRSHGLRVLLEVGVEALSSCADKDRFAGLARIFSTLASLQNDPLLTARLALPYFWADPEKAYVAPYVDTLIQHGELPELDPDELLAVMRDEAPKIDMLVNLASEVSENRAIGYLRRALRLCRQLALPADKRQGIMQKLSALTLLQEDELDQFVTAAKDSGDMAAALTMISQQLKLVMDDRSRAKLCVIAADFLSSGPLNETELDVIRKAISTLPKDQQAEIKVRWLEVRGYDARLHAREFISDYLSESKNWKKRGAIVELLSTLRSEDSTAAKMLLSAALQRSIDAANYEELEYYLESLDAESIIDVGASFQLFESFAKKPDFKRAQHFLIRTMVQAKQASEADKYLQSAQELLISLEMTQLFQEVLVDLHDPLRLVSLSSEVQREVSIAYARWQVMQGRDLRKALGLLEQLYALDQMDTRLWGPLIAIYRELNADTDLYELLYRVMPILRSNPDILRPFRIQLNQIEEEMVALISSLGLMPEQTDITMIGGQFPREASVSKSLVGPYGTAVNKPQDQRDISTVVHDPLTASRPETPRRPEPLSFGPALDLDQDDAEQATQKLDISLSGMRIPAAAQGFQPEEQDFTKTVPAAATAEPSLSLGLADELAPYEEKTPALPIPPHAPGMAKRFREEVWSLPPLPQNDGAALLESSRPPEVFQFEDWKTVATQAKPKEGLTAWLLEQPSSDKTEQHIALQVAAIAENKVPLLETWPHCVWREAQDVFYELRWNERMGRELFHPGFKSPLVKLIKTLQPLIQQQFAAQLSAKNEVERFKMRLDDLHRVRRAVDWTDEVFQRGLLSHYQKIFAETGITAYHLPRLEDKVQYHPDVRELYIDCDFYRAAPPSQLLHRLLFLYRSLQIDCYALLHLNPHNDIYSFLLKCRRSLEQGRMDNVRRMLGMEKDSLKLIFSQVDREHLDMLFAEVGTLTPDKIAKACGVFVEQIYRINLAETLDLIGLVEALSGQDLLAGRSGGEGVQPLQNPLVRQLMAFASDLKFPPRS